MTLQTSRFTFYVLSLLLILLAACTAGPQPDARQPVIPPEVRSECPVWGHGGSRQARQIAYAPDGQTLAVAGQGISLRDAATGRGLWCLDELDPRYIVGGMKFSPDGQTLGLYVGMSSTLQLHSAADGTLLRLIESAPATYLNNFAFSPDGRYLATATADHTVHWYSLAGDTKQLWTVSYPDYPPLAVTVSPDGRTLAVRCLDGKLDLLSTADGARQQTFQLSSATRGEILYTADGATLITWSNEQIEAFRLSDGQSLFTQKQPAENHNPAAINHVALSPDNRQLAVLSMGWLWLKSSDDSGFSDTQSGVNDRFTLTLWNTADWSFRQTLSGGQWIYTFAYTPDGTQIVTKWDDDIAFWNLQSKN